MDFLIVSIETEKYVPGQLSHILSVTLLVCSILAVQSSTQLHSYVLPFSRFRIPPDYQTLSSFKAIVSPFSTNC